MMKGVEENGIMMKVALAKMVPANVYCEYFEGEYCTGEWQSQNKQKTLTSYINFV